MPKDHPPKDDITQQSEPACDQDLGVNDSDHLLEEHSIASEPSLEEQLRAEVVETKDRLLRLAAEFENYKKISQREHQNGVKFANEGLMANLLPIIDSLEHAVAATKAKNDDANNSVLVGVEMVLKQLNELLKKFGVEIFSALGKPFDPSRHEAMGEQVDDQADEGSVVVEYQKGYFLHGRLLRPARVVIAKRSGS